MKMFNLNKIQKIVEKHSNKIENDFQALKIKSQQDIGSGILVTCCIFPCKGY